MKIVRYRSEIRPPGSVHAVGGVISWDLERGGPALLDLHFFFLSRKGERFVDGSFKTLSFGRHNLAARPLSSVRRPDGSGMDRDSWRDLAGLNYRTFRRVGVIGLAQNWWSEKAAISFACEVAS